MGKIKEILQLIKFKKEWRDNNSHNYTVAKNIFNSEIVDIGKMTYGHLEVHTWGSSNEKLSIGSYVSIASGVKFLLGGNHYYNTFSTYPFKVKVMEESIEAYSNGAIVVEDDVWIGTDATILSGVRIGQGAVIAAGSMIVKDVPPYSIVGGNPAKVIKYRFNQQIIDKLLNIDFNSIDEKFIKQNIDKLYLELNEDILDELIDEI